MLSLLVLGVPIVAVVWFQASSSPEKPNVPTVKWRPTADKARQQASFSVLAPPSLPSGWRATHATWTRAGHKDSKGDRSTRDQWRLGVLTKNDTYIELDQGDKHTADMIKSATRGAASDGAQTVDGHRWKRRITDDGRTRALVRPDAKATTVVTGDTSYATLRSFAASLQRHGTS